MAQDVLTSVVCVLLCVAVHLRLLPPTYRLISSRIRTLHRATAGVIVLVAILGHLFGVALFGAGYAPLGPAEDGSGFAVLYHSAAAYPSHGDSQPATADWRVMTAGEPLTAERFCPGPVTCIGR
ncbi:MAG: hypothetical protein JWO38_3499 [Gemmataceae bacterium]|nr:hypothetical protein [Gemmataceae bacterium]